MDSPPGFSLKRKREHRRKHDKSEHEDNATTKPGPDILKSNKQSTSTSKVEVGPAFNGVVEEYFDGGVRMKVKVGDTEMKGVAFYPIPPPNVVPPDIKMATRKDLAIPAVHSSLLHRSAQGNRQRADVKREKPADP